MTTFNEELTIITTGLAVNKLSLITWYSKEGGKVNALDLNINIHDRQVKVKNLFMCNNWGNTYGNIIFLRPVLFTYCKVYETLLFAKLSWSHGYKISASNRLKRPCAWAAIHI